MRLKDAADFIGWAAYLTVVRAGRFDHELLTAPLRSTDVEVTEPTLRDRRRPARNAKIRPLRREGPPPPDSLTPAA